MPTEPIWFAKLAGDLADLEVTTRLVGRTDLATAQIDNDIPLELLDVARETTPELVLDRAQEIVRVVNGLGRLYVSGWADVALRGLFRREVGKPPTAFVFPSCISSSVRFGEATVAVEGMPIVPRPRPIDRAFAASQCDKQVEKLLRLLGSEDRSFRQLYVAYEVIENAVGGQHALEKRSDLCNTKDVDRFKHTANSVTALGDLARHAGKEKKQPPNQPMTLQEARSFVADLAKMWLASM